MLEFFKQIMIVFVLYASFYCGHRYFSNLFVSTTDDSLKKTLARFGWLVLAFVGVAIASSIS